MTAIVVGIGAAAVYFHISLLLQINWEKLKKQQTAQAQKNNVELSVHHFMG
ncbi:MAG: hypothetical protein LRY73_14650 [Bacillus sp. (in: Bacteria)]|nr:hypothetical protein [Bacillus sp. (in: firmicutes)]